MTTKELHMTREEFIAEAKRLRQAADDSESQFLDFLFRGEQRPSIWQATGEASYPKFLEVSGICKAIRYIKYKEGVW